MTSHVAAITLGSLLAVGAFGQTSLHFEGPPRHSVPPTTGAPYSGERVREIVQTLADGSHVTREMPSTKVYRDSQGRTRTETRMLARPARPGQSATVLPIVDISDPVARVRYVLDVQNKIAVLSRIPACFKSRPTTPSSKRSETSRSRGPLRGRRFLSQTSQTSL